MLKWPHFQKSRFILNFILSDPKIVKTSQSQTWVPLVLLGSLRQESERSRLRPQRPGCGCVCFLLAPVAMKVWVSR